MPRATTLAILAILPGLLAPLAARAQLTTPKKISATVGETRGTIERSFDFPDFAAGATVVNAGDVDRDGIDDPALDADASLWILFMNGDGTVRTYREAGGGWESEPIGTVAHLGDLDGDEVPDLLVTVYNEFTGFSTYIWYLNENGTVWQKKKVCDSQLDPYLNNTGGFGLCPGANGDRPVDIDGDGTHDYIATLDGLQVYLLKPDGDLKRPVDANVRICNWDRVFNGPLSCHKGNFFGVGNFGSDVVSLGDLDGDGVPELAVGGAGHDDGCEEPSVVSCEKGAVWILFMYANGTVRRHQKISQTDGNFTGVLADSVRFGQSVTALDDLDGDGVPELAVGAPYSYEFNEARGEVWILFLQYDEASETVSVKRNLKITQGEGSFTGTLDRQDHFGSGLTRLGDIDDDPETVETLVVMSMADEVQGGHRGALWFLFLKDDGTVKRHHKMRSVDFLFYLLDGDHFGQAVTPLGDLDGDGVPEVAVGAPDYDRDDRGAVWVLFLNRNGTIRRHQRISAAWGGFADTLAVGARFGASLARLSEPDDDGVTLAVGAPGRNENPDRGAVYLLHLNRDGTVRNHCRIAEGECGFDGALADGDHFGAALASLGVSDLAVGAPGDDEGGLNAGAVYVLHFNQEGTVQSYKKNTQPETIDFGRALADLGPRGNAHGLAVGARSEPGVWVLDLDASGRATKQLPLSRAAIGVDAFAASLASPGDIDADGFAELALGTSTGAAEAMTLLFLDADSVKTAKTLESLRPGTRTGFGHGLASLGDFDGDGLGDLAIGAPFDSDGGTQRGALWLTSLRELLGAAIEQPEASPAIPALGQDIVVSTRIEDLSGRGLTQTAVLFRRGGEDGFSTILLEEQAPGAFQGRIPALANGERGVEYVVSATNGLGITTTSDTVSVPIYVPEGLRHPLQEGDYRLISVPLYLDDKSSRALLEDDLGPYDRKRWRFFGKIAFAELGRYDMEMLPGWAYWLLVEEPGQVLTTGPGRSLPTDRPFRISLRPGFNLVGDPFGFPVAVTQVRTRTGQAVTFQHYAGDWAPADSLFPFEGYVVHSEQPDTLIVFPRSSLPGTPAKQAETMAWSIRIRATDGHARDTHNYAAVAAGASVAWDALDQPEPPVVGDYVRVSFPHAEWERRAVHYSRDVRPAVEGEARWVFAVTTQRSGRVEVGFEGVETVPPELGVWLEDAATGHRQDLRSEPGYAVVTGGGGQDRLLTLVVGPRLGQAIDEAVPSGYVLETFPNPFRGAATIRYGLPEASVVRLEVYDVLGRRVAVLASGEASAGYHGVLWEGRSGAGVPLGSGLYVVRLRAGGFEQTRTMVRIR